MHKMTSFAAILSVFIAGVAFVSRAAEDDPALKLPSDKITFQIRLVHKSSDERVKVFYNEYKKGNKDVFKEKMPDGNFVQDASGAFYLLEPKVWIDEKMLDNGEYQLTRIGTITYGGKTTYKFNHQIKLLLNRQGTQDFAAFTKKYTGRRIAFFLNGRFLCAPEIKGPITNGVFSVRATEKVSK